VPGCAPGRTARLELPLRWLFRFGTLELGEAKHDKPVVRHVHQTGVLFSQPLQLLTGLVHGQVAIGKARTAGVPVILVQHVAAASRGPAPFFNAGTPGVELHPRLRAAAPDAPAGYATTVMAEFAAGAPQADDITLVVAKRL